MKTKTTLLFAVCIFAFLQSYALVYTVEVPTETNVCYIVGANVTDGPTEWNTFVQMNRVGDTNVFTIDLPEALATAEYSYCAGPSWPYEQVDEAGEETNNASWSERDVVIGWKAMFDPNATGTINITAIVPDGTEEVVVLGSYNNWSWNNAVFATKNNDGTFSFAFTGVVSVGYRLYNKLDWEYYETDDIGEERPDRTAVFPDDDNTIITVIDWAIQTNTSRPSTFDDKFNLNIENNSVIINNVYSEVSVFDIIGHCVQKEYANGKFASKRLATGIYIIRTDGLNKKVMIK